MANSTTSCVAALPSQRLRDAALRVLNTVPAATGEAAHALHELSSALDAFSKEEKVVAELRLLAELVRDAPVWEVDNSLEWIGDKRDRARKVLRRLEELRMT